MFYRNRANNRLYAAIKRAATGFFFLFFPLFATAHPHSWIEMKTYVDGKDGMITGLRMVWSFDPMTSAYMLDGEDTSSDMEAQTFTKVTASVLDNMMYEHYFTYFYDGEEPIKYQLARYGKLTRDRARLVLTFELPLSKPQPVTADSLKLLVFEPSYYVDMSWLSKQDVILSGDLADYCEFEMIAPNPTPEQMSYAMSLPADADPDNALGQLFTQSVRFRCQETDHQVMSAKNEGTQS
ncbi:DUF1007 family protein [Photobacterium lutimaris]|uniref:DUF1007 domain-containing protein n=1 Tax=Photobacterium lutimaris TaxID=388278 RepID=A0A2T3IL41_9GAMM|nr:DUF1007 family protein [Photobacterium lutimaris]PSU29072.1 DUF1007 domain-containing protein [Photobacterium lutimaris]TDR75680.1 tRNA threonylcarbamoyladenosine biosynthesis protein TsaE [Photobacterium lutimaris]